MELRGEFRFAMLAVSDQIGKLFTVSIPTPIANPLRLVGH